MKLVLLSIACMVALSSAAPSLLQRNTVSHIGSGGSPAFGEEIRRWLHAVRPMVVAPDNQISHSVQTPFSTLFNSRQSSVVPSRGHYPTIYFDTFPHEKAVLELQQRRMDQHLPIYLFASQRPGFPFFSY